MSAPLLFRPCSGHVVEVHPGDLFILGDHRILCGDATNVEDVRRVMDGTHADLCVTDPPYNVAYGKPRHRKAKARKDIDGDNLGDEFPAFVTAFVGSIHAALKPGAGLYLSMSAQEMPTIYIALKAAGFKWSCEIVWDKMRATLSWADYRWQHEPIWYGWKTGAAHLYRVKDRTETTIWRIPGPTRSPEHPTMKPVEWAARAIRNSSAKGDVVFEPFSGSGTTLIACEVTGRSCRAIELDPKYVKVAVERWERETGKNAIRVPAPAVNSDAEVKAA